MWVKTMYRGLFITLAIVGGLTWAGDWPAFRGANASGYAKDAKLPASWSGERGENIRWRTKIPGMGHSSPVIVGDKVFVTSAVGENPDPYLRVGLYGESPDHPEDEVFKFNLYCLDKKTGKVLWERTAHEGKPKVKRHIKSTHANPTPATNGKVVLAFFGSEGLYCYTVDGKLLWKRDLGLLDAGAFNAPEIQWGFGSSPIIYKDRAVVLCDVNNQSFIAALDLKTGKDVWRKNRDETPTWGTPTIAEHKGRTQVIVNGYKHLGAYDFETGEEIWKLSGGGDIPVPTPVVAHGKVYTTSAHGPARPIYAISLDAKGDITLGEDETSNDGVAWSIPQRGAYMPTPLVHGDYLYVPNNRGIIGVYNAHNGEQAYRERIGGVRGSYSASPVAGGENLYVINEEGDIHILKLGGKYEHVGTHSVDELSLATPAISGDMMFVRTKGHLVAIGDTGGKVMVSGLAKKKEEPKAKVGKPAKEEPFDPKDPTSIFKRVDAAAKAVDLVRYKVSVEGLGFVAGGVGLEAQVTAQGYQEFLPQYFRMEGMGETQGQKVQVSASSDGNRYYLLDHQGKELKHGLEVNIYGRMANYVRQMMIEYHHTSPFTDEINAPKKEIKGSETIGGVDCWVIDVVYDRQPEGSKSIWYIGKKDFLPYGRNRQFMRNGEMGGFAMRITQLEINPKLEKGWYNIDLPEGYTKAK